MKMEIYDKYLVEKSTVYQGDDKDVVAVRSKLKGLIMTVRKFGASIRTDEHAKLTQAVLKGPTSYVKKIEESLDFVKGFIDSIKE